MSDYQPPQQGPYNPQGQYQPYNNQGYTPIYPNFQQPVQPDPKKKQSMKELWNSGNSGKCGIIATVFILLFAIFACTGVIHAATSGSQSTTASTQVASASTPIATTKPVPTAKPKPTVKPTPAQSLAQIETAYKASATNTDIVSIDKDGSTDAGMDVHFSCAISNFVKDTSGTTTGANVTDTASSSGTFIQVIFTPGTDITQLNTGDILEVWGSDQGAASGTNAFGSTIQEVVIQANYMKDQTTNYTVDI